MSQDKLISVRFNEQELQELEDLKDLLGLKGLFGEDSKAIKLSITFSRNVVRSFFGGKLNDVFSRAFKEESARKEVERREKIKNVLQSSAQK